MYYTYELKNFVRVYIVTTTNIFLIKSYVFKLQAEKTTDLLMFKDFN